MKTLTRCGTLGLLVTLAACNAESTGPELPPLADLAISRDIATQSAEAAAEDVELMGGPTGQFGFGFATSLSSGDEAPFLCGTHTRDLLTIVRTCTFKNAAGATQSGYDATTTASAVIHAEVTGKIERENWSAEVTRIRDLTVTGLAGAETSRTWNGTGTGKSTRSRHKEGTETRMYDVSCTSTRTNVVVNLPRSENQWPVSGTINRQCTIKITGGPNDGKTVERTVTITFNGTQMVPITVNGKAFTLDLKTRKVGG